MREKVKTKWYEKLFCIIFSGFIVLAYSFDKTDSAQLVMNSFSSILVSLVIVVFLSLLSIGILNFIKFLMKMFLHKLSTKNVFLNKIDYIFSKYPFSFSIVIILLFWLPYAIIRFPAVTEWDAYHQIIQGLGFMDINYVWPIASTMFMSSIVKFGNFVFGDYNSGVFLLVIVQMTICATCLAYSIKVISKLKIHPCIKWIVLLVYSIATIYPRYLTAIVKDSLFSGLVVWFVTIQVDIVILKNNKLINYIMLFFSAFLMCIFRSNGIYIVYFCIPVAIFYLVKEKEKNWLSLFASLLITVVFFKVYNVVIESKGVPKTPISEALSIPFQQTARYIRNYPEDMTSEEKDIINSVLLYDTIKEKYNPRLSDYVKGTYHGENASLIRYFGVWFNQFFRHPLVYFSATFNNCFEFFYPLARESESGLYKTTNNDVNIKIFNEELMHDSMKKALTFYIECFESIPVLNFNCNTGLQFWATIYLVLYSIFEKKGKMFYILIPSIVGILVCIASPTYTWNGIRYALPVIYTTPILLSVFVLEDYSNIKD